MNSDNDLSPEQPNDEPKAAETSLGPGLGWGQLIVLSLAVLWLGSAAGYVGATIDRSPSADSADVGFLQDMITHHEQALTMAQFELANGELPEVQIFAREILMFQSYEIGRMEAQLEEWGHNLQDRPPTVMGWMGSEMALDSMAGLASKEQMDALRNATGTDADRLFLELMAVHHRGGADMGQAAARLAGDKWVVDLASRQARNQKLEIIEFIMTAERVGLEVDIEPFD